MYTHNCWIFINKITLANKHKSMFVERGVWVYVFRKECNGALSLDKGCFQVGR